MFDRLINVITLLICALGIGAVSLSIYYSYQDVPYKYNIADAKPWEKYNDSMNVFDEKYSSERLRSAIESAREAGDDSAVSKLSKRYAASYTAKGVRRTRLNSMEWGNTILVIALTLSLLLVPMSINYVRHGKPRLWNREIIA